MNSFGAGPILVVESILIMGPIFKKQSIRNTGKIKCDSNATHIKMGIKFIQ